jgi:hypothetical protein
MKKPGLFAVVLGAAILCAAPLSLHWSSDPMPSLSFDTADAQNRVAGVNRRIGHAAYGPNYRGNPYVNYRYVNPYVNKVIRTLIRTSTGAKIDSGGSRRRNRRHAMKRGGCGEYCEAAEVAGHVA